MSTANPTRLRIGMSGMLDGRKFTVLGRVVYGVRVELETYYWNEFYLGDRTGESATLVFEEMEYGPTWKLFRSFKPAVPLSVQEAAAKRVGESLRLSGQPMRISLVGISKVYHIEGAAPEGVALDDVDNYFNAGTGKRMLVVCWKGEKIEFYEGRDLPHGILEAAFGLPPPRRGWFTVLSGMLPDWDWEAIKPVATWGIIVGIAIMTQVDLNYDPGVVHPPPPPKMAAPARQLQLGAEGMIAGKHCRVVGHALGEVGQVGRRFDRHEYLLVDDAGGQMLLVQGLVGDEEWRLFKPQLIKSPEMVYKSAAIRAGTKLFSSGHRWQVTNLFVEQARQIEGQEMIGWWPANTFYGFVAVDGGDWLMLRWTEAGFLQGAEGQAVGQKDVLAAFERAH